MAILQALAIPFAKLTFGTSMRLRLYEQLQALLEGDLKLDKALDAIYDRASKNGKNPYTTDAIVVDAWRKEYRKAASLSAAVSGWVPARDKIQIDAGELGGNVAASLAELQDLNRSISRMRGALMGTMAYPAFLTAAIVMVLFIFGRMVLPEFAQVVPTEEWTGAAASLAGLSNFVDTMLFPLLGGLAGLFALIFVTMPNWRGKLRVIADKMPPWSFFRLFQGVAFLLSLSALLRAGIHLPVALGRLRDNANPWMRERIDATLYHVRTGASLGDALDRAGHDFPDATLVADLKIFSQIAGVDTALARLGRRWVEDGVKRVEAASRMIRNLMMFAFTGLIAWLYMGLFDLYQILQQATAY